VVSQPAPPGGALFQLLCSQQRELLQKLHREAQLRGLA